jgi:hypothetical protein
MSNRYKANKYTQFLKNNEKNIKKDKTVIMVWKQSFFNLPTNNFWGLGDLIRGTIGMFKLSKKYNFNIIVDLSLHPLSQFLKNYEHPYSNIVRENKDNIPFIMPNIAESYITNKLYSENKNYICLCSNMPLSSYDSDCSSELSDFIKNIFCPNDLFSEYFLNFSRQDYTIIHYRLGDSSELVDFQKAYEHLIRHYKKSDIFITDSQKFKSIVSKDNINMLKTKVCHIGYNECYEELRDTLVEFFTIMNSKKITSFSTYSWISGFVYGIHYIFNIPLEGHINVKF